MSSLKTLKLTIQGPVANLAINNPPVNAMSFTFWQEFLQTLTQLESNPKIRCLTIYSALKKPIFTAGNDLNELYAPKSSQERFYTFWKTQTSALARLYKTRLFTVALLFGHVPAGGCGLAMCCDYRIMLDSSASKMGLNEVQIGILVPKFWGQLMQQISGSRGKVDHYLMTGQMIPAKTAFELGLLHELLPQSEGIEGLQKTAQKVIESVLKLPDTGRVLTKGLLKTEFADAWEAYGEEEAKSAWEVLSQPSVYKVLGKVMESLQKSKL